MSTWEERMAQQSAERESRRALAEAEIEKRYPDPQTAWEREYQWPETPGFKALGDHLDEHGCGTGDIHDPRYVGGWMHCPVAAALWDAIPIEERPPFLALAL